MLLSHGIVAVTNVPRGADRAKKGDAYEIVLSRSLASGAGGTPPLSAPVLKY